MEKDENGRGKAMGNACAIFAEKQKKVGREN